MRRIMLIFACIVLLFAQNAVAAEGAGKQEAAAKNPFAGGPSVFFPSTSYKFDQVLEGAKIEHAFVVENRGKAPLRIGRVRPD